jgi:HEAT repeat protein
MAKPMLVTFLVAANLSTAGTPLASRAADEPSDAAIRDRVNAYLGAIDPPVSVEQWQSLGPRAIPVLQSVVKNRNELPTRRAKAIGALAGLHPPRSGPLFDTLAANEDEPLVVRLAAVRGLAQVTPAARVAPALRPFLERAKDSRVRGVAAEQLATRTNGRSCDLVRAQAAREAPDTRGHFRKALARCEHQN